MKPTISWIQQTIAAMESQRDEAPFGISDDHDMTLEAFKLALAGMEAKPAIIVGDDGGDALAYRRLLQTFEPGTRLYTAPQPLTTSERAELENYRNAQQLVTGDIDARMKSAGMLSASEIIAGQPIDAFVKHAGVVDMGSLLQWSEMRRAEFLRMQARYELGDKEKDDLYEWVISHVAVFSELHVNIRAAMQPIADMAAQLESALQHIDELEAAPPAPVGDGDAPVPLMPDFPGRTLTQRECYRAGFEAGKALRDGWVMVPVDATREMIDAAAHVEEDGFDAMHKAMIAAAPQQEA